MGDQQDEHGGGSEAATVIALHRYPVKSLLGESVDSLDLDARGCTGDRVWSVRTPDGKIGSGKATRRFAAVVGLLELRAATRDGRVVVTFPDGRQRFVDDPDADARLSDAIGQPLRFARETEVSHFDDGPVSLLASASVDAVAEARGEPVVAARFRPNIVLDGVPALAEDRWVEREVQIGVAVLRVLMQSPRCVMVDMKTADLPAQPGNLTTVGRLNHGCVGVIATVVTPGQIRVGDRVHVR